MESALDKIVRDYVANELQIENSRNPLNGQGDGKVKGTAENPFPSDKLGAARSEDSNYVQVLHDSLEKKGVMRELQAFLRQKLVLILQDKWPKLTSSSTTELIHPVVLKLIQDFLCSRKLLYTLSVVSSELGLESLKQGHFGKMRCASAENLLEELNIKKYSQLSRLILKAYTEKDWSSLLECIIHFSGWSEDRIVIETSTEDKFLAQNTSLDGQWRKMNHQFQEIYNVYREKENKNVARHKITTDERFHVIEKALEKDKNAQIQLAIKRFREEEEPRIRDEIKHKLEFEMLAKENELLINYKEKSQCLDREKAAWVAEKCRQENELVEKQREAQSLIQSLAKKSRDSQCSSCSRKQNVLSPRETNIQNPKDKEHNIETTYRELLLQSDPVIREAQLPSTIKRLQEENERLATQKNCTSTIPRSQIINPDINTNIQPRNVNCIDKIYQDKIAFLQYNLKEHTEEINRLRGQLSTKSLSSLLNSHNPNPPGAKKESDLLRFLSESKRRCEQIELEARSVDQKLNEIRTKRSRSSSPARNYIFANPPQRQPNIPGPYSTIMAHVAAEQLQVLKLPTPRNNIPFQSRKYSDPFKPQPMVRSAEELRLIHAKDFGLRFAPNFAPVFQIPPTRLETSPKKSTVIFHDNESNENGRNSIEKGSPPSPGINLLALRRESNSAKLVKAVKRGALSFEKVTSSDEESSQRSSLRQDLSVRNRRVSFENGNQNQSKHEGNGKAIGSDSKSGLGNSGNTQHAEKLEKAWEPTKLVVEEGDDDKSLSISAPNDISRGSGEDSEFWKL